MTAEWHPADPLGYARAEGLTPVDVPEPLAFIVQLISLLENYGDHHDWCPVYAAAREQRPHHLSDCTCRFSVELERARSWRDVAEGMGGERWAFADLRTAEEEGNG